MNPVSPKRKYIVLGLIFITFPLFVYFMSKMEHRHVDVGILYPKEEVKEVKGEIIVDTVYHTVPEWSFTNQDGEVFNSDSLKGKIYIADFFFTTCPSICPAMARSAWLFSCNSRRCARARRFFTFREIFIG